MKKLLAALAVSTACMATQAIAADDGPVMMQKDWFIKAGAIYIAPDSSGTLPIVGGNITAGKVITPSLEAGRFLSDRFSLSIAAGLPPAHEIYRNGIDTNTTDTLGAVAALGQFHLLNNDKFDFYVGGGLAYNIYFGTTSPTTASIDNGFAPVVQVGMEYKANETVGVFVDLKKEFYTTTIHNSKFGPFQERLDPLAISVGLALHF